MKKNIAVIFAAFVLAGTIIFISPRQPAEAAPQNMNILSPAFPNGGDIPAKYTCDGSNAVPKLDLSDIPQNAKSLALIVDDPDAPNGTFNHWVIWNIDPSVKKIDSSDLAGSTNGKNSAGKNDYIGPCPPSGTHRYFFKVYALDEKINLDNNSKRDDLLQAMEGHILAQGELMGKYER